MARSKDVLAVMGLLCVDRGFRSQFFQNPRSAAAYLVGALNADELTQIDNLGGNGKLPATYEARDAFISQVKGHFDLIYNDYECPDPPCPSIVTSGTITTAALLPTKKSGPSKRSGKKPAKTRSRN